MEGVLSTAIGSFPHKDIDIPLKLSLSLDIPLWPQLVKIDWKENMYAQFSERLPCIQYDEAKKNIYFSLDNIEDELTRFYEKFQEEDLEYFSISPSFSKGFWEFLAAKPHSNYIKGQITGPITFCLSICDSSGKPVIYHPALYDAIILGLLQKALWQAEKLKAFGKPIIFIDEPYLASFGSAITPLSKDNVVSSLAKIINPLKERGIITGIHCCGNTDWSIIMETGVDILSFDAWNFKNNLFLYKDDLERFIKNRILAWGIIPSSKELLKTNGRILKEKLRCDIAQKSFLITPSCGLGSLPPELAEKAIEMTISLTKICQG